MRPFAIRPRKRTHRLAILSALLQKVSGIVFSELLSSNIMCCFDPNPSQSLGAPAVTYVSSLLDCAFVTSTLEAHSNTPSKKCLKLTQQTQSSRFVHTYSNLDT